MHISFFLVHYNVVELSNNIREKGSGIKEKRDILVFD